MLPRQSGGKMSAPSCVAYVGLRFPISDNEVEALEERRDDRQLAARSAGLKSYWGRFGLEEPAYALFVGSPIGSFGPEGDGAACLRADELLGLLAATRERLGSVGMSGEVGLYVEWQPD